MLVFLCESLLLLASGLISVSFCSLSECCVKWFINAVTLLRKREPDFFAFLRFVACVLSAMVGFLFLFGSLVG